MWQSFKNTYHLARAIFANFIYGFYYRGVKIIGVTGTDGKTTTASLIYHTLNQAGYKAALITSISAIISGKSQDIGFHVTTPRIFALRSLIKKAKKSRTEYIVLEVTSHAIDQHRVFGIPFSVAVITNVSREHLDYHKTYEKYVATKCRLLKKAKTAILNKDDKSYNLLKKLLKNKKYITYGLKSDSAVNPHNFPFNTRLIGKFNKYNSLAAISVLQQLNIPDSAITKGIATFKPPIGRQEIVFNKDFKVIIDFAHTPNSLHEIMPEIKKITPKRLIHVFGSAGLRDIYKRPEMGKISSDFSDVIILTAEDPRRESVEKIISEIEQGINTKFNKKNLIKISDRKQAITKAIEIAQKGDTILLTGKGHESSMNYGKGEVPWSEHEVVQEALRKI